MEKLEFCKIIYRVDYPACFRLISQTGELLDFFSKEKKWESVGEDPINRKIVLQNISNNAKTTLIADPTSISGIHESNDIDLQRMTNVWLSVNAIVNQLKIEKFARIGVRFHFLCKVNKFEESLVPMSNLINSTVADVITGNKSVKPVDCAVSLVFNDDGLFTRFNLGPIKKEEYKTYFELYKNIEVDFGAFYDVDYYTNNYEFKSFRFDKFVMTAYNSIKEKVEKLNTTIISQENLI